jgi:hypothetical protein
MPRTTLDFILPRAILRSGHEQGPVGFFSRAASLRDPTRSEGPLPYAGMARPEAAAAGCVIFRSTWPHPVRPESQPAAQAGKWPEIRRLGPARRSVRRCITPTSGDQRCCTRPNRPLPPLPGRLGRFPPVGYHRLGSQRTCRHAPGAVIIQNREIRLRFQITGNNPGCRRPVFWRTPGLGRPSSSGARWFGINPG